MIQLLNKLQRYIKAFKEPPHQTLVKLAHRIALLDNQFIDGMHVNYQGDDEMDGIECPICKYEVARNDDDDVETRPKHCPECGTKLIY